MSVFGGKVTGRGEAGSPESGAESLEEQGWDGSSRQCSSVASAEREERPVSGMQPLEH